jgi:hypothetical protein
MTFFCIACTRIEIEFDSRYLIFKESSSRFLGDDDNDSTKSMFYGEECTSAEFDNDYLATMALPQPAAATSQAPAVARMERSAHWRNLTMTTWQRWLRLDLQQQHHKHQQ